MEKTVIGIAGGIVAGIMASLYLQLRKSRLSGVGPFEGEAVMVEVTMKELSRWFREHDSENLQGGSNVIRVLMKPGKGTRLPKELMHLEEGFAIIQGYFNETAGKLSAYRIVRFHTLAGEVRDLFDRTKNGTVILEGEFSAS